MKGANRSNPLESKTKQKKLDRQGPWEYDSYPSNPHLSLDERCLQEPVHKPNEVAHQVQAYNTEMAILCRKGKVLWLMLECVGLFLIKVVNIPSSLKTLLTNLTD